MYTHFGQQRLFVVNSKSNLTSQFNSVSFRLDTELTKWDYTVMSDTQSLTDPSFIIHSVPVFQKDLAAVYKLLADRNPDAGTARPLPAATAASVEDVWTEANLVALFGMCKTVHRAILARMAEAGSAQKVATYEELRVAGAQASQNADFDYDNMRGNLAWISKYMIKITGSKTGLFVFTDRGPALATGQRYEYRMPKAIADVWLRIVKAA